MSSFSPVCPQPWFGDLATSVLDLETRDDGSVRAEDAISAAAAVAGEACLMGAGLFPHDACPFPQGRVLLSDVVNGILTGDRLEWAEVPEASAFGLVRDLLPASHFTPDHFPPIGPIFERFASTAGTQPLGWVPLSVPAVHTPRHPPAQSAMLLRPRVEELCGRTGAGWGERYRGCTAALVQVLIETREVISPRVSLPLALETLLSMAKLAPAGMRGVAPSQSPARSAQGLAGLFGRLRGARV